jgi:hypothetical protein
MPHVDYSTPPALNIDRLMQHVCNSNTLNYSVQDIVADAEQYKSGADQRAASAVAVPVGATSSVAAPPQNPALRRLLAGAAAASEAAAAVFGPLGPSGTGSPQGYDAAAAAGVSARGLTLPLSTPAQLTPQQQLVLYLRRRLLPLRTAARRIAAAEAWAQHVAAQQQKRAQAAVASNAEDDMLLQGLADDAGQGDDVSAQTAVAANTARANGAAFAEIGQGVGGEAAGGATAPAANGLPAAGGKSEADVQQVLEQRKPSIAARAEQLLLQQPLVLSEVLAGFQVAYFSSAQQLNMQVSVLQSCWVGVAGLGQRYELIRWSRDCCGSLHLSCWHPGCQAWIC